jgi:MoxR-like ATPase
MRNLENMLRLALLTPMGDPDTDTCIWGAPVLLLGDPGIGKSDRIKAVSDSLGLPLRVVYPSTRAPEDFSGAPFVRDEKIVMECILGAVRDLVGLGRGVLHLDELSCAMPAVQAAGLSLVQERRAGDTLLPGPVRVLAAANPPGTAAGGWQLEPPMANRFIHVDVPHPNPSDWVRYMLEGPEPLTSLQDGENLVRRSWKENYGKAVSRVTGFMSSAAGSMYIYTLPPEGNPGRSGAWASPRTWSMATRLLATAYCLDDMDTAFSLLMGTVGTGPGAALFEWLEKANLPTPLDMCTGRWSPDPHRADINMAAVNGMSSWLASQEETPERDRLAVGAWEVLQKIDQIGQLDVAVPAVRTLEKNGLGALGKQGQARKKELAAAAQPLLLRMAETSIAQAASK